MLLKRDYIQSLVLATGVIFFVLIYFGSIRTLFSTWRLDWNSHGFLLLPLCFYMFYKSWLKNKDTLVVSFSATGFLVLLGLSLVWLLSKLIFVEYVELVSLPLIFLAMLVALYGWQQSRVFWFPVLLMLLGSPLLGLLIPALQNMTANGTGFFLDIIGLSNMVDGVLILVPAGTFEVDRGCSGLNVLTVGAILSLLYAYINEFKIKDAVILLLLGLVVSVTSNIIRVLIIVIVGNASNMQHSLVHDHVHLGWIVFLIFFGTFIFFTHRYYPVKLDNTDIKSAHGLLNNQSIGVMSDSRLSLGMGLLLITMAVGPGVWWLSSANSSNALIATNPNVSTDGKWKVVEADDISWHPVYITGKGNYEIFKKYINAKDDSVYLDLRYYAHQGPEAEAINSNNSIYNRDSWTRVWHKPFVPKANNSIDVVEEALVRANDGNELLVWRWYAVDGIKTGNLARAKLYNLIGMLTGVPEVTVYIVASKVDQSYKYSRDLLQEFSESINLGVTK